MTGFKYIQNIADGVGEIRVYDNIGLYVKNGKERGVSGSVFADEMAYLKSVCNKINIRFNSDGGSVLDGYGIFSSILNAGVETESFIDGVAASTAGWCAMAANKCSIMDYATLMVHGASGSDDKELISMVNNSIAKMLSNRTGMTAEEAGALMNKETWYSASNPKDSQVLITKKLVDSIVTTDKKIKIKKTDVRNLASIYNKLINTEMSKLNKLLNLGVDAEEKEQEAAVVALNKELTDSKAEIETLKNELKSLKDEKEKAEKEAKEALKNRATEMVKAFNKAGKIADSEVESTIANASKDEASFAFVSNLLGKIGNGKESKKPFDFTKVTDKVGGVENRSDWSWSKWSKEDPAGLQRIANETPEVYQEMYNKEFKK